MDRTDHTTTAPRQAGFARRALAALLVAAAGALPAGAKDANDHERARRAVEAGEVLPLRAILDRVAREHPGQIMEVELEREDGRWIYEIRLLREGGALVKLEVDGRDGQVLRVKRKDDKAIPGLAR